MLQKVMLETFSWSVLKSRLREMLSMSAAAAITSTVAKLCKYTLKSIPQALAKQNHSFMQRPVHPSFEGVKHIVDG